MKNCTLLTLTIPIPMFILCSRLCFGRNTKAELCVHFFCVSFASRKLLCVLISAVAESPTLVFLAQKPFHTLGQRRSKTEDVHKKQKGLKRETR